MTDDETDAPSVARIYDYLLGGAQSFQVDRDRADEVKAAAPSITTISWANRNFLRHAVEHALGLGIRQFLDLGSGIPTVGNVHEIAQRHDPGARVAYVDNEPVAVARSRDLLADVDHATITDADLRDPDAVLGAPTVAGFLDVTRPVALLTIGVLPFVPDEDGPAAILARYRGALSSGSVLALTQPSQDYPDHPELVRDRQRIVRLYADSSHPVTDRSRAEILAMVEAAGFHADRDGLVELGRWSTPDTGQPVGGWGLITEPI